MGILVGLCVLFLIPSFVMAATLYVASNGSDTSPYDTWSKASNSIQTAIDAAGSSDVIIVGSSDGHGSGTYSENVTVNKQVTIQSENGNSTTTIQASNTDLHVFEVTNSYVTINGFSIYGATGWDKAGIYIENVTNCTIQNNRCGWDGSHQNMKGILLVNSDDCTLDNNTTSYNSGEGIHLNSSCDSNDITDNTVTYNTGDGISLASSSGNTIEGNTASNNGADGFHLINLSDNTFEDNFASDNSQNGFLIVASSSNDFIGNTANDNLATHGFYLNTSSTNNTLTNNTANSNVGNGIRLEASSTGNTLTSNTVTHNEFGFYVTSSSNNTFTSNIMNDNDGRWDGDGIMLDGSSNCLILNNTANDNPGDGIEFCNASNNTVKGNTLDTSGDPDPGASMRINYYSSNNVIVNNTVINGSKGIVLEEVSNYNSVAHNTIYGHTEDGIEFYENSSYNIVMRNSINNNVYNGVWLPLVGPPQGPAGNYNQIYLNNFVNNSDGNIFSEMTTTTWHAPAKMYYDYDNVTYNKDYLGNYYDDGNHSGSYGLGGTYTIANDNNDDYQLIQTSDNYTLQAWWLSGDNTMYGNDVTQSGSELTISGNCSNIWITNVAATGTMNFPGSDTWTGQLVFSSAPTNGHTFTVEAGYSTNGSDFTAGGPDATVTADGSSRIYTYETDASAFSVTSGKYLALRITNNNTGSDYDLLTGGAWNYCSSPDGSSEYTLPVILSIFTAQFLENTPTLYWSTQSEVDNLGWFIYRNDDNEFSSSEIISEMIEGHGTTTQQQFYIYQDTIENLEIGSTYYYWLESIDLSGISQVYSRVAQITIPKPSINPPQITPPIVYDFKNVPNPVIGNTNFQFTLDTASLVSVEIYNILGELVYITPSVLSQPDKTSSVYWNAKDRNRNEITPGVYFYNLIVNGKTEETKKLILMK
jgi:parallel beta-helix repeat protein